MDKLKLNIVLKICLIFAAIFFLTPDAKARTLLNKKDVYNYEFNVKIVFDFQKEAKDQALRLLTLWEQGMHNVWNANYRTANYQQDILLKYRFELIAMAADKTCQDYSDYHCFTVVNSKLNQRGNLADTLLVSLNSQQNSAGEWTTMTTGLAAAHEAGHLLGLADEYHYDHNAEASVWVNDNYQASGQQSIMAQTWNESAALPEHTLKILTNIK